MYTSCFQTNNEVRLLFEQLALLKMEGLLSPRTANISQKHISV